MFGLLQEEMQKSSNGCSMKIHTFENGAQAILEIYIAEV
jgi:hypothetical protein